MKAAAFAALAFNHRSIGFNLLISSGHEIVTGLADRGRPVVMSRA